jgi:hypothetical protein|tara:strand:+ start:13 stop:279 length:267 start_codon:yes stop_codon:yes gene_type:complete
MNLSEWQGVAKASELIGVSQSLLWELKNSNEFIAGEHWLYITGKPKSNVLWNVRAIRQWQIDKTKASENIPDDIAAKEIATYSKVGGK